MKMERADGAARRRHRKRQGWRFYFRWRLALGGMGRGGMVCSLAYSWSGQGPSSEW